MDQERSHDPPDHDDDFEDAPESPQRPRELPADLPRSLDDRKNFRSYNEETEYYDAWQGRKCKLIPC
jgi:hypothetical protein